MGKFRMWYSVYVDYYEDVESSKILQKEKLYAPIENDRVLEIELKLNPYNRSDGNFIAY